MQKKDIIDLIKYHFENNNNAFKQQSLSIARDFDKSGDPQLASYIMSIISQTDRFLPQGTELSNWFQNVSVSSEPLPLPTSISEDIKGIINVVKNNVGFHKFLFIGSPGTGKTESVKQISRILNRELLIIDFNGLIDSKLGQTAKNITELFSELNSLPYPDQYIFLFDEIDALVLDRINSNDLREMGRVTSTFLKMLDNLNEDIILVATTNLYENLDKALTRRFDATINFDRYTKSDLIDIGEIFLNEYLKQFKHVKKDIKIFKKILNTQTKLPYPADLKNIVRTSLAFSDTNDEYEYLKRILKSFHHGKIPNITELSAMGFTVREIEILTGISKSSVSRELKERHQYE